MNGAENTTEGQAMTLNSRATYWYYFCLTCLAGLVICMILLGGYTRLTGSGLSMVDWHPIMGIIPPLTDSDWLSAFIAYQQSPEFQQVNQSISLGEFKQIFIVEYAHRVLGRLIGIVLLIPTAIAILTPTLRQDIKFLMALWILGGTQGFLGWYMVKSGLVSEPWVSSYRLTVHLMMALVILSLIVWRLCGQTTSKLSDDKDNQNLLRWAKASLALVILAISYGGLTAGLKAGYFYNTFPLMDGSLTPDGMFFTSPWWVNLFENPGTVQFLHRWIAISTCITILWTSYQYLKNTASETLLYKWATTTGALALGQVTLGLFTLLYQVPLWTALAHQAGAILLFSSLLILVNLTTHKKGATSQATPFKISKMQPATSDDHQANAKASKTG